MKITNARFVASSGKLLLCPPADRVEYAFIGRSNVGKSSLINALVNRKNLAHTSSTPGKTQVINHFIVNEEWYLVDLPGYGYAQVSREKRAGFQEMITDYLKGRESLVCTFVLIDSRHEPQKIDLEFMAWMAENGLPFAIVFTKADKLSRPQLAAALDKYKAALLETWEELPVHFVTSAETKSGLADLAAYIGDLNGQRLFIPPTPPKRW